jgi:dTDP-4-amino-4,6-dideoxygalactose transaminase
LLEAQITPLTRAMLPVHIFGNPADIDKLEQISEKFSLKLIFDSAHAFGSMYEGVRAGRFGDAEVFSLSPTKLLVAGEGGLVATDDDALAGRIRIGRDYGNPGNYNPEIVGFNARMPEFNAALAIGNLETIDFKVKKRNELAMAYKKYLEDIPGVAFQKVERGSLSTYKDFSILIDPSAFGLTRDELSDALVAENIMTKKYYYPPVHRQKAYSARRVNLPVTERISKNILSLPIYSHMPVDEVDLVCLAIRGIHENASRVRKALKNEGKLQ